MAMDRVGGVARSGDVQKSDNDGTNAVLVKRGEISRVHLVDGASNANFDNILQKVEKKGSMSLNQFSELAKMTDGGKEAFATYLKDNGIMPAKTVEKLKNKEPGVMEKILNVLSSPSLISGPVGQILKGLALFGLFPIAIVMSLKDDIKLDKKEGIKNLRDSLSSGATDLIHELKKIDDPAELKKFIKDKNISPQEYDSLSKYISFEMQLKLAEQTTVL